MQILAPVGLALAALAIPILLLYMLKLRRKQVRVSSTLLWERLLRDQQANTPWQKIKRNLQLFLQLLILAALTLAFMRPAIQTPVVASGSVIVLLDASASMNASEDGSTRFETARRSVQTLINSLPAGSQATLILVGGEPQVLVSAESDKALLRDALSKAQPTNGGVDWQAAFALAAGAAHGSANPTTVIVSDGGLPESGLPALPGEVRYVPTGAADDNLAITALSLRAHQLFAEVTNFSAQDRSITLSIYLGEELLTARQLDIPAGTRQSFTLDDLADTPGIYRARMSAPQGDATLDALPLDDSAYAIDRASSTRRVLLVSTGNLYLEQMLASLPGIQPFRVLPGEDGTLQIPTDPFDLYIFDGIAPEKLPDGNILFINAPSNELFEAGEIFQDMKNIRISESPLAKYVDWSNVHVLQAKSVTLPDWATAIVEADAGPLVFAGETGNRRVAALTFDLRESDLPLQVAYPILFSNLINYLIPPAAFDSTQSLQPGESLNIAIPPGTQQVVIATPSGTVYTFTPTAPTLTFTETAELGYYAVNFLSKDASTYEYFAVNLFNPAESNIRPNESIQVGRTSVSPSASEQVGQRELWPLFAALALAVLLIEWQVYHRRSMRLSGQGGRDNREDKKGFLGVLGGSKKKGGAGK